MIQVSVARTAKELKVTSHDEFEFKSEFIASQRWLGSFVRAKISEEETEINDEHQSYRLSERPPRPATRLELKLHPPPSSPSSSSTSRNPQPSNYIAEVRNHISLRSLGKERLERASLKRG